MSYVEQTWTQGDVITAEKLNHMESGIAESGGGSSALLVTGTDNGEQIFLNKTFTEIKNAFAVGAPVLVTITSDSNNYEEVTSVVDVLTSYFNGAFDNGNVFMYLNTFSSIVGFFVTSADACPQYNYGD